MLVWDWKKDRIGTWTEKHGDKEYKYNLYSGNALCIMIAEFNKDGKDQYQLSGFFCDKEHMKSCLGLAKQSDGNIYKDCLKEIEIKADYRHTPVLVQMLAKAEFDNDIKITLLQKDPW